MKKTFPPAIANKLSCFLIISGYVVLLMPVAAAAQLAGVDIRKAAEKDSLGDYNGEIQVWNWVIQQQPAMAQAWHLRGKAKYQLKDYRGAIADQQRAAQLQPGNEEVYLASGYARLSLKQYHAAAQDLSAAIAINPNNTTTWYHRGFIWKQLGQHKKARFDFSTANELGLRSSKDKLISFEPE